MSELLATAAISHQLVTEGLVALGLATLAAPLSGAAYEWLRDWIAPRQTLRLRFASGAPAKDISIIDIRTGKVIGLTNERGFATIRWVEAVELWGGDELFLSHNARPNHWLRVANLDRSAREREMIVRPRHDASHSPEPPAASDAGGEGSSPNEGEEHER